MRTVTSNLSGCSADRRDHNPVMEEKANNWSQMRGATTSVLSSASVLGGVIATMIDGARIRSAGRGNVHAMLTEWQRRMVMTYVAARCQVLLDLG